MKGAVIRGRGANSNRGAYQNLKSYGGVKPRKYGKYNEWKELTKLIQNDLGTILIGRIVAEIFYLESTPKLLTVSFFLTFL